MKKKRRTYNVIWIILLAAVVLVGGSGIAALLYLDSTDRLKFYLESAFYYLKYNSSSALILTWGIILPMILVVFIIVTALRRNRVRKVEWKLEDAINVAVEAEREDFKKRQSKNLPGRFGALKKGGNVRGGEKPKNLRELCVAFREYSAGELGLYFSERTTREFISSLATSKILILQGITGSGKTSLAYAFGEFLNNPTMIVPVQPMWKERADLLGYYNEFTRHFNETALFRKLYEANFGNKMYITALDEMNIARIEYYFAEFLSLLELPNPELRYLEATSDSWDNDPEGIVNGCIKLPENMWFAGTVNNDDSAYAISDKVYDRAMVIDLSEKAEPFAVEGERNYVELGFDEFEKMAEEAKNGYEISEENLVALKKFDNFLIEKIRLSYGNRIRRQIKDYCATYIACGGTEKEALDDILAKKVLRKMEYKDLSRLTAEIDEFIAFLGETFGKGEMKTCVKYLEGVRNE